MVGAKKESGEEKLFLCVGTTNYLISRVQKVISFSMQKHHNDVAWFMKSWRFFLSEWQTMNLLCSLQQPSLKKKTKLCYEQSFPRFSFVDFYFNCFFY